MMFRTAELGQRIPKSEFKQKEPVLRQELLEAQQRLLKLKKCPVMIIFAGVDGAGKGETVNLLNAWMDPRWLITRAYDKPSDEEKERPEYWRFWRDLLPKGKIGLFLSSSLACQTPYPQRDPTGEVFPAAQGRTLSVIRW